MPELAVTFILAIELLLMLAGLVLLWRLAFSTRGRAAPRRLRAWEVSGTNFFIFIWMIMCGIFLGPVFVGVWMKTQSFSRDVQTIYATAGMQLGMLAAILGFKFTFARRESPAPQDPAIPPPPNSFLAGCVTYLIVLPVVIGLSFAWQLVLKTLGIDAPPQEALELMRNAGTIPFIVLLVSAVVIAPISEELTFRAGIFRFMRTRTPRWLALLLPSAIFGAMHANLLSFLPLVGLGVVFSLAYERTGRIGTTMVAHALFNLSTTLVVLAGLDV